MILGAAGISAAVYLAGYYLSVAVAIGFIALGGIAVETAVVMLLIGTSMGLAWSQSLTK